MDKGITLERRREIRQGMVELQERIAQMPGAMFNDCFPLTHTFSDGIYVRQITVPKGMLIVTKIHKKAHPYFLLEGECSVMTEEGVKRIRAPFSGITPAGTKRVVFTHADVVWTTVHKTDETDLEKIEEELIAENFEMLDSDIIEINNFITEVKKEQKDEV